MNTHNSHMVVQAAFSITAAQAKSLFGSIATHSCIAGATLQLRDTFFNDRFGRKVQVIARSRETAARAMKTILFQLCQDAKCSTKLEDSTWKYFDNKGEEHGPFPLQKMVNWAKKDAFKDANLRIQHAEVKAWFPIWFLVLCNEGLSTHSEYLEVSMADLVVQDSDQQQAAIQAAINDVRRTTTGANNGNSNSVSDFPELSYEEHAEPMDYELSTVPADLAPDAVRIFVIVDTNVLISHFTFMEKAFQRLVANGAPRLEAVVIIPWIVLNELDKLKDARGKKLQSDEARFALKRLRVLTAERDGFVRGQTAAEHAKALAAIKLPDVETTSSKLLRGDDMIIQSCLHYQQQYVEQYRKAGHSAAVFLLSNDGGLCLRASVNGIKCYSAQKFPTDPDELAKEVPPAEGVDMAQLDSEEMAVPDWQLPSQPTTPTQAPVAAVQTTAAAAAAAPHSSSSHPPPGTWTVDGFTPEQLVHAIMHVSKGEEAAPEVWQALKKLQSSPELMQLFQIELKARDTAAAAAAAAAAQQQEQAHLQQQLHQQALIMQQRQQQQQHELLQAKLMQRQTEGAQLSVMAAQGQHYQQHGASYHQGGADNTQLAMVRAAIAAAHAQGASARDQTSPPPDYNPPNSYNQRASSTSSPRSPTTAPAAALSDALAAAAMASGTAVTASPLAACVSEISHIIEHCLANGVKYYRQQDLGEDWLEMLSDNDQPPWQAKTVVHIIVSHNTTFWGVLNKDGIQAAKQLERFLRQVEQSARRGGLPDVHSVAAAAHQLYTLLVQFLENCGKNNTETEAPNPAEVPDFVSLGAAKLALTAGVDRAAKVVKQCS